MRYPHDISRLDTFSAMIILMILVQKVLTMYLSKTIIDLCIPGWTSIEVIFKGSGLIKFSILDFYYGTRPQARSISPGDLSIRLHFRDTLQCKPFDWYMKE